MNRTCSFLVLACLGGLVALPGCSQGAWTWLNPQQSSSDLVGSASVSGWPGFGSKSDPKTPKNPFALARLSERQGQTAKAEQLYQEILKKSPDHVGAHHRLGVLYARQGKMAQAEKHFARALALKPDHAELLNDVGYFYYLTGRMNEAERCLRRALELEPGNRKYCTNLALAVAEQGRRDEAYALFRQAGSEKEATANMAFVLAQQGEYQQALNLYDRVLTEDPTMRVAADAMIELSKRIEQNGQHAGPQRTRDAGPVLAAHTVPAPDQAAASHTSSLATVSDGRPVPPPWAASRDPGAVPPVSLAAAPQGDLNHVRRATLAAQSSASWTGASIEPQPTVDRRSDIAAGIPCAYVAPAEPGATSPPAKLSETEATLHAPPKAAAANSAAADFLSAAASGPGEGTALNRPTLTISLPVEFFQPSTLALFLGLTLMGAGTIAWWRRAGRQRVDSKSVVHEGDSDAAGARLRSRRRAVPIVTRRARA